MIPNQFFREALTISPDDPQINHELGSLSYQNGEYEQAKVKAFLLKQNVNTWEHSAWRFA